MSSKDLLVTTEISMYPLTEDVEPPIIAFIHALRDQPDIDIVTNAMSTQLRGRFEDVQRALTCCMAQVMLGPDKVLFVTKTLNLSLDIEETPDID